MFSFLKSRIHPASRAWLPLSIGLAALALAIGAAWKIERSQRPIEVAVATGGNTGLNYRFVNSLAADAGEHRLRMHHEVIAGPDKMVAELEARTVDFTVLLGGGDLSKHGDLRQVAALHVEPIHLVVKEEIHTDVSRSLHGLKGKVVQLGSTPTSVGSRLARELLMFAGLNVGTETMPGDIVIARPNADLMSEHRRERLPDAIFMISGLPSATIRYLVVEHRYRLVPLPFGRAFSLGALADTPSSDTDTALLKERIIETLIPACTYQVDPAVPADDLPTLGARVLVVTHRATKVAAVERLLETIYASRFVRAFQPDLTPSVSESVQELPWHPGALSFIERDEPLLTGAVIGNLANSIQVVLPALTALFCLGQWLRQRARSRRQDHLEVHIRKVIRVESEAIELEPTCLNVPSLTRLERELCHIKAEVLELFFQGELRGADLLSNFLAQISDARLNLSMLILKARDVVPTAAADEFEPPERS